MRVKPITAVAGFILLMFMVLGAFTVVQAQEGGTGFRVSPARYDLDADPGDTLVKTVEITNLTSGTQKATPVVNDFIPPEDESGSPQLIVEGDSSKNPRSIQPFVLPLDSFTIEPGESKNVDVMFSIPEGAAPGAYYGVVRYLAETEGSSEEDNKNISLLASVGTVFLLNVRGDTVSLLTLEEAGAANGEGGEISQFFPSAPDRIAIRLRNSGNTFEAPFGRVDIKDWRGNVVYSYELNNGSPRSNVLPDSVRRFEHETENIGAFGRFTIESYISYGDGGSIIEAKSTFWVIPWIPMLGVVLLVVGIAFMGTRGLKEYNARVIAKSKKGDY